MATLAVSQLQSVYAYARQPWHKLQLHTRPGCKWQNAAHTHSSPSHQQQPPHASAVFAFFLRAYWHIVCPAGKWDRWLGDTRAAQYMFQMVGRNSCRLRAHVFLAPIQIRHLINIHEQGALTATASGYHSKSSRSRELSCACSGIQSLQNS